MTDFPDLLVPTHHARVALQAFSQSPELLERLLAGSGISADQFKSPQLQLPLAAMLVIADNVTTEFGPGWFLNLPVLWGSDVQTELGMAMRYARDFGAALDIVLRYTPVRWPLVDVEAVRSKSTVTLRFIPATRFTATAWALISSLALLNFQSSSASIIGADVSRLRYTVSGDPPPFADRLIELIAGSVSYNSNQLTVVIPADLLDRPAVLADDNALAAMTAAMDRRLAGKQAHPSITLRVENLLANTARGQMSIAEAADHLGLSRRTLERRLAAEGQSYRELLDQSLRSRFVVAVRDNALKADQIAEQLGYHDGSSLQRACRRWFGKPYLAVRREELAKNSG